MTELSRAHLVVGSFRFEDFRKLATGFKSFALSCILAASSWGCGYKSVYATESRPEERLTVVAGSQRVPNLGAVEAALSGARAELSSAGMLRPGPGYPRMEIDVLRVDELSSGISAQPTAAGRVPIARGSGVAVVLRGLIYERPGIPARDTGDIRRTEWVASGADVRSDAQAYDAAVRSAARRAGRAAARRALGIAEPANETP